MIIYKSFLLINKSLMDEFQNKSTISLKKYAESKDLKF